MIKNIKRLTKLSTLVHINLLLTDKINVVKNIANNIITNRGVHERTPPWTTE